MLNALMFQYTSARHNRLNVHATYVGQHPKKLPSNLMGTLLCVPLFRFGEVQEPRKSNEFTVVRNNIHFLEPRVALAEAVK